MFQGHTPSEFQITWPSHVHTGLRSFLRCLLYSLPRVGIHIISLLIECLCGRGGDAVLSTLCKVFPPTWGLCLRALQGVDRGSVRCASCSDSATSPPRLNPGPSSSFHTCGSPINCTADYSILCLPPGEPTHTPPPFFITSFHLLELKNHQMETFI